jgi:NAD(P)-dependent dehydrogenase (short-subunit alcohol dehydrogenase family)
VYRWDASDFEACAAGIREVEAAVGPIDVLVYNAGIVRDLDLAALGVDSKQIREKRDARFAVVQSVSA